MRKFFIPFICFFLVLTISSINIFGASSLNDLKNKKNILSNNIKTTLDGIKNANDKKQNLLDELNKLDAQMNTVMDDVTKINVQLNDVNTSLEKSKDDLKNATAKKDLQQKTIETRIRYLYEFGQISYLETIFSAKTFSDFMNRLDYIQRISDYDNNMYSQLQNTEDLIVQQLKDIDTKRVQVEVLQKNLLQKQSEIESSVAAKQSLSRQIENDITLLNQQKEIDEKASKSVEMMILDEQVREAEMLRIHPTASKFIYTGGKLLWPVPSCQTITSPYGYRIHPITHVKTFHEGVDIGASMHSAVVAAADGIVLSSGVISGYGNAVVISHGSNMSTLYGHNSVLLVKAGQKVKRGQQVSWSGNTGNSTGPHLHFEVRINGKTVNPLTYLR